MTGHHDPRHPAGIDTSRPNPARIYDALLGGKDNFPADRDAAEAILDVAPPARRGAKENRAFLQRAVRYLAREAGIRQFLDIGTGLPTQGNVHQIAQAIAPDARVAYVDHDPVVHVHANALLADNTTTVAVLADLREPEVILGHPEVRRVLDFTRPLAVLLVAVLHFLRDEEDPAGIVARLRDAMAPRNYVVIGQDHRRLPAGVRPAGAAQPQPDRPVLRRVRPGGAGAGAARVVAPRRWDSRQPERWRLLQRCRPQVLSWGAGSIGLRGGEMSIGRKVVSD